MKAESQIKGYTVAAGRDMSIDVTGSKFWLVSTTGNIQASFDDGPILELKAGYKFSIVADLFKRIRFINPDTSSSVTFTFYAGTLDIDSIAPYVFTKPAPTYFVPYTYNVTNAADTTPPVTNLRAGKTIADSLSHVIISNNDGDSVHVRDLAGTVGLVIPNGTIVQLTLTQQFYLRAAPTTGPWVVRVMLFYNYDS